MAGRGTIQKGGYAVSVALAGIVLVTALLIQQRWQLSSLKDAASSAEEFILSKAGLKSQVPDILGFEILNTFVLGHYRAALYRATSAPLVFAPGRFVIYDGNSRPAFKLETLEGSREPWTALYNFAGRQGATAPGNRPRPVYARSLTGNGQLDIVVGHYSGGNRCCTTAIVLELGKEIVRLLGRIEGLEGLPFVGLEFRKLNRDTSWEIIAHRRSTTLCGSREDAADLLSVYAYTDGQYTDQTARFADFFQSVVRKDLAKWSREKARSMELLQTLAVNYALAGQREEARRFFATNLAGFVPQLRGVGVDPNSCLEDLEALFGRLPSGPP